MGFCSNSTIQVHEDLARQIAKTNLKEREIEELKQSNLDLTSEFDAARDKIKVLETRAEEKKSQDKKMEDMQTKIFELEMEKLKIAHAAELASEKEKQEIMKKSEKQKYEILKNQKDEEICNLLVTRDAVAESVA